LFILRDITLYIVSFKLYGFIPTLLPLLTQADPWKMECITMHQQYGIIQSFKNWSKRPLHTTQHRKIEWNVQQGVSIQVDVMLQFKAYPDLFICLKQEGLPTYLKLNNKLYINDRNLNKIHLIHLASKLEGNHFTMNKQKFLKSVDFHWQDVRPASLRLNLEKTILKSFWLF